MCTCKRPRNNDSLILGRVILLHLAVGNLANLFIGMLNIDICNFERFCKRHCNEIKLHNLFFLFRYTQYSTKKLEINGVLLCIAHLVLSCKTKYSFKII